MPLYSDSPGDCRAVLEVTWQAFRMTFTRDKRSEPVRGRVGFVAF